LYDKQHPFATKGNEVSPKNETECAEHCNELPENIRKKEKRKEILKDSERSMVRGEEGYKKDDTCKEIAKVYCPSTKFSFP
jgi:hypothetical protein